MFVLDLQVRYDDEYVLYQNDSIKTWSQEIDNLKFTGDNWVTQVQKHEVERRYSIKELIDGGLSRVVYNSWE